MFPPSTHADDALYADRFQKAKKGDAGVFVALTHLCSIVRNTFPREVNRDFWFKSFDTLLPCAMLTQICSDKGIRSIVGMLCNSQHTMSFREERLDSVRAKKA